MAIVQAGCVPAPFVYFACTAAAAGSTRRHILALVALALIDRRPWPGQGEPARKGSSPGVCTYLLAPTWFDPAEMSGIITPYMVYYALHDALVKPMPGQPFAPEPCQVVVRFRRRPRLRVRPARRREVSQRRAGDGRGREVLLRALQGRRQQGAEGPGRRGRDPRSATRPLQAQAALARLHDLLYERHGCSRGSCRRSTWSRSATRASRRRPSAPAPTSSSPSRPAWS